MLPATGAEVEAAVGANLLGNEDEGKTAPTLPTMQQAPPNPLIQEIEAARTISLVHHRGAKANKEMH
jgi:hypothetical protein